MIKFKKGDKVYSLKAYNDGQVHIKEIEVQSWGAKQGTATTEKDGKFIKSSIFTGGDNSNVSGTHYYMIGSVDPIEKALELSAAFIAHKLESNKAELGQYNRYQPSIEEAIAHFSTAKPSIYKEKN